MIKIVGFGIVIQMFILLIVFLLTKLVETLLINTDVCKRSNLLIKKEKILIIIFSITHIATSIMNLFWKNYIIEVMYYMILFITIVFSTKSKNVRFNVYIIVYSLILLICTTYVKILKPVLSNGFKFFISSLLLSPISCNHMLPHFFVACLLVVLICVEICNIIGKKI